MQTTSCLSVIPHILLFATVAIAESPTPPPAEAAITESKLPPGTYWVRRVDMRRPGAAVGHVDKAGVLHQKMPTACMPVSIVEYPSMDSRTFWTLRLWKEGRNQSARSRMTIDLMINGYRQPPEITSAEVVAPISSSGMATECREPFIVAQPTPTSQSLRSSFGVLFKRREECGVDGDVDLACDRVGNCTGTAGQPELFSFKTCDAAIQRLLAVDRVLRQAADTKIDAAQKKFAGVIKRGGALWEHDSAAGTCQRIDARPQQDNKTSLTRIVDDVKKEWRTHFEQTFRFNIARHHAGYFGSKHWSEPLTKDAEGSGGLGLSGDTGGVGMPLRFGDDVVAIGARLLFLSKRTCETTNGGTP